MSLSTQIPSGEIAEDWKASVAIFEELMGKKPKDVNAFLFVIGVQELGKVFSVFRRKKNRT